MYPMSVRYSLFKTAIGWAGLAWGADGLVGAHLPEGDPETARRSFLRRFPEATEAEPTPDIRDAEAAITALMADGKGDLTQIALDIARVPPFNAQVYAICRAIPPGETLTYGEIALQLGDKRLAREVGQALGQNPWPMVVPCHRVTAAGGKLGGFSARGGQQTKLKLLAIEGAAVVANQPAAQADLFA
jgi:methylated-DNA-[protein]-cysteine S-methyltransferase